MSPASLHYNFLHESERVSSSPIRMRFMVPIFSCIITACMVIIWQIYAIRLEAVKSQKALVDGEINTMKESYSNIVMDRVLEKELRAELKQLSFYKASCNRVGETLHQLTNCVSDRVQITEMRLAIVPIPKDIVKPNPKTPIPLGPTNLFDTVSLRVSGRAHPEGGSGFVDGLLRSLQSPAFSNVIQTAVIPKGAFRQEANLRTSSMGEGGPREVLLFEINCNCQPRRYE